MGVNRRAIGPCLQFVENGFSALTYYIYWYSGLNVSTVVSAVDTPGIFFSVAMFLAGLNVKHNFATGESTFLQTV